MILVCSCGRTGTNLMLEVLTGHPDLVSSDPPEDKLIFKRDIEYQDNYITKCDLWYCNGYESFRRFMNRNKTSKIVWTIRNPKDVVLSKLRRGWMRSDDGTPKTAIENVFRMWYFYLRATKDFNDRIITVKMEDIISNIDKVIQEICNFIGLQPHNLMYYPHKRMRHKGKRDRYKTLDKDQVDLWKTYNDVYNGFFKDKNIDFEKIFKILTPISIYFGYEE